MKNTEINYRLAIERYEKSGSNLLDYFNKMTSSSQKMFLAAAKKHGIDTTGLVVARSKVAPKSFRAFSLYEIKDIIAATQNLEPKYKAVIMTMLETGCRRFEIVLIWEKFKESRTNIVDIYGKGDKKGRIFITKELRPVLEEWVESPEYRTYSNEAINKFTKTALKLVGLDGNCHDLRRAFATNLRNHFVPIEHIQVLLRHEDLNTTLNYIKVSDDDIWNSLNDKYLNVDEFVNKNNFREKYLELLQKNMRQAERIKELENELQKQRTGKN